MEAWGEHQSDEAALGAQRFVALAVFLALGVAVGVLVVSLRPIYVVGGLVLLAIAAAAFVQPFVGGIAYVVATLIRPGEIVPALAPYHLERVVVAVLLVSLGTRAATGVRQGLEWKHSLHRSVFALLLALAASCLTSIWPSNSVGVTGQFAKAVLGYVLLSSLIQTRLQFRWTVWTFLLCVAYQAFWSYRGFHAGGEDVAFAQGIYRAEGMSQSFGDSNTLAGLLAAGLPFAYALATARGRPALRAAAGLIAALLLVTIPLTGSRGGFLGLCGVLLVLVVLSRRRLLTAAVVLGLGLGMWLVTPPAQQARILSILTYQHEGTYLQRQSGWGVGRRMFLEHPLLGVGIGNFGVAHHDLYQASWLNAHSVYYQVLGETGLVGVVAFGWFIIAMLRVQARTRRRLTEFGSGWMTEWSLSVAITAALWSRLITGLAAHNLGSPTYYFVAALTVALDRLAGGGQGPSAEQAEAGDHAPTAPLRPEGVSR